MRQLDPVNPTQFLKSAALGALTGIVFAVVLVALPGAALIFVVGVLELPWDLSWFPGIFTIMTLGGAAGAFFAVILFIKDRHVPYVEEVQDFEEESENDRFKR
ncbi:hypothetical protein A9Q83_06140 [Alphaproteobacteria bacterium 46_93_T64]|nr:hypothetical protein A9Q83_06140 [Alphaproteobacteria bacterium 46_93_T64]